MKADATLTICNLNAKLLELNGTEIILTDQEGKPLPESRQMTLGNALLGLIVRMRPPETPREIMLARRVGENIALAMEAESEEANRRTGEEAAAAGDGAARKDVYVAGSVALGILRAAARHNGPGYSVPVLAQVWVAIGDGED